MIRNRHKCHLLVRDTTDLPKLAPNAHWIKKLSRALSKLVLANPNHYKCAILFRNRAAVLKERRRHASGRHFFVIHPMSTLGAILEAAFVILWLYLIIMESLLVFVGRLYLKVLDAHRKWITPFQLALILLFFNTGYFDRNANRVVLEPRKIICRYLVSYFIFDYLSTYISADLPARWILQDKKKRGLAVTITYIIRVCGFTVRLPTLIKFMNESLRNIKVKKTFRSLLCHIVRTYLLLHLFAFMIVAVPSLWYKIIGNSPSQSWKQTIFFKHLTTHQKYFETMRIVFCYFFGIPHIFMEVVTEQICAVIISFTGRLYTLYLLADILSLLGIVGVSESMYQRSLSLIQNYMTDQGLPDNLKRRVLRFYQFKFQGRHFSENQIKDTLSNNLRAELFLFTTRKMIQKSEVFKNLPRSTIEEMMDVMKCEIFSANDVIIKIDSEINEVYFISSGTVAVMTSDGKELCHLEDGEEFGTSCLFFKRQKHPVVAIETTEVFIINKNQLMKFLYPYPDVMNEFYRSAKEKLANLKDSAHHATTECVNLLSELQRGNILEKRTKKLTSAF